jgi:hypothetical protein
MPARYPKVRYRPMPPSVWIDPGALACSTNTPTRTQPRNRSHSPNPRGNRSGRFRYSQTAIGTAAKTKMISDTPSTHQSGKPR